MENAAGKATPDPTGQALPKKPDLMLVSQSDRHPGYGRTLERPRHGQHAKLEIKKGTPVYLVPKPPGQGEKQATPPGWSNIGIWLVGSKLELRLDPKPNKEVMEHTVVLDLAQFDPGEATTVYLYKEAAELWVGVLRLHATKGSAASVTSVVVLLDERVTVMTNPGPAPAGSAGPKTAPTGAKVTSKSTPASGATTKPSRSGWRRLLPPWW